jgi:hypothetical protein
MLLYGFTADSRTTLVFDWWCISNANTLPACMPAALHCFTASCLQHNSTDSRTTPVVNTRWPRFLCITEQC